MAWLRREVDTLYGSSDRWKAAVSRLERLLAEKELRVEELRGGRAGGEGVEGPVVELLEAEVVLVLERG